MSCSSAPPSPCGVQQSPRAASTLLIRQTCLAALRGGGGRRAWRRDAQPVNLLGSHLAGFLLFYGGGGERKLVSATLITREAEKFYQPAGRHGDRFAAKRQQVETFEMSSGVFGYSGSGPKPALNSPPESLRNANKAASIRAPSVFHAASRHQIGGPTRSANVTARQLTACGAGVRRVKCKCQRALTCCSPSSRFSLFCHCSACITIASHLRSRLIDSSCRASRCCSASGPASAVGPACRGGGERTVRTQRWR